MSGYPWRGRAERHANERQRSRGNILGRIRNLREQGSDEVSYQ